MKTPEGPRLADADVIVNFLARVPIRLTHPDPSSPGLTRRSMDPRVKPAGDGKRFCLIETSSSYTLSR